MSSKPFAFLKIALNDRFAIGSPVMFDQDGKPHGGVVIGHGSNRFQVQSFGGKTYELIEQRLARIPGSFAENLKTTEEQVAHLESFFSHDYRDRLQVMWEKALASGANYYTEEALLKLEDIPLSLETFTVLRLTLLKDRSYFSRSKDGFLPRTNEEVERFKALETARIQLGEHIEGLATYIQRKQKEKDLQPDPGLQEVITLITECGCRSPHLVAEDFDKVELICNAVEEKLKLEPHSSIDGRAYQIAVKAGSIRWQTNLSAIRHRQPLSFPQDVLDEAETFSLPQSYAEYSDTSVRRDLTHLDAFTIDDESTMDMDDALSLTETDEGFLLGIHISDVAYGLPKDSNTDRFAKLLATSVYCPEMTLNMLPEKLSHELFSLCPDTLRPCFSCLITIDRQGALLNADIVPSVIRSRRKLSYTKADELLFSQDAVLTFINNVASAKEQERIEQGAMRIMKREVFPVVKDKKVSIIEIDEQAPSRNLVGEMMVLANTLTANFLLTHEIPGLFRSQDKPDPIDEKVTAKIPLGPARDYFERTRLKRSIVSLHPAFHTTLGLYAYVQATSPIRRYLDLVLQRQMLAFFRKEPFPYTKEDLEMLSFDLEGPLQRANLVSRESKKYWLYRYLQNRMEKNAFLTGVVVRADAKTTLVELDELFITVLARLQKPKLGDRVKLKIITVDPRTDYLRLEEQRQNQR